MLEGSHEGFMHAFDVVLPVLRLSQLHFQQLHLLL